MNDSVRKWINGKTNSATFTVDRVSTGHRRHHAGCGVHDNRPNRARTRGQASRRAIREAC